MLLTGLAFFVALPVVAAAEEGGNLLPNPSFEETAGVASAPVGWQKQTWGMNSNVARDDAVSHNGRMSVRISNPSDNDRGSYALFMEVKPGQQYRFTGWYRTEGVDHYQSGKGVIARFSMLQEKEQKIASHTLMAAGEPRAEWVQLRYDFLVPDGISWLRLDLFLFFQRGTVWWDDVSLITIGGPQSVPVAGLDEGSLREAAMMRMRQ